MENIRKDLNRIEQLLTMPCASLARTISKKKIANSDMTASSELKSIQSRWISENKTVANPIVLSTKLSIDTKSVNHAITTKTCYGVVFN